MMLEALSCTTFPQSETVVELQRGQLNPFHFPKCFFVQGHVRIPFVSRLSLRNNCEANWPIKIIPNLSNRTGKKKLGIHHSLYATLFNGPTYRRWWNDLMEFINFELCYTTFCQLQRLPHVTLGKMTAIDVFRGLKPTDLEEFCRNLEIAYLIRFSVTLPLDHFLRGRYSVVSNSFFEFFNSLASDVNSSDGFLFTQPTSSFLQRFSGATRFFVVQILQSASSCSPFLPPALWRCPTLLWLREKPRGRRRRRTQRSTFSNDPASLRMIGGCKLKSVAPVFVRKFDVLIILQSS